MSKPSFFTLPPVAECPHCGARCWPGQIGVAFDQMATALDRAHGGPLPDGTDCALGLCDHTPMQCALLAAKRDEERARERREEEQ